MSGSLLFGFNGHEASASQLFSPTASNSGTYQTALPDLLVSSLTLSPEKPSRGDAVTVRVTVRNQGSAKARSVYINFYTGGSLLFSKVIDVIEAGESAVTDFIWNARYGTHLLKIVIDEDNWIEELNETNNSKSILVTTVIPDIIVKSLSWSPTSPKYGENVTFTVTLKNQGEGRSGGLFVLPVLNNVGLDTIFFAPLDSGSQKSAAFSHVMTDIGDQMIRLIADPNDGVYESNEYNNELLAEMPPILPDLIIDNITWTPTNPSVGETIRFSVRIKNQGRAASELTRLHYYIGAVASGFQSVGEIKTGGSVTVNFTWEAETGKHLASVIIDPVYAVTELDEDNNRRKFIFSGTKAADLVVTSISWAPAEPVEGTEITFSVTVKNQGNGPSLLSEIGHYINDSLYSSSVLNPLKAGALQTGTFTWTVREGTFQVRAIADLKNTVMENAENNNDLDKMFIYPIPADLIIEGIGWAPRNPVAGQKMTFSVILRNQGTSKSADFTVGLYIDDTYMGFVTVDGLESGVTGKNNGTFTWTAEAGNHAIKAVIDPSGKIIESDKQNNEQVMAFTVSDPDNGSTPVVASTTDNASVAAATAIDDEEVTEKAVTEPKLVAEEQEAGASATQESSGVGTGSPWAVYVFGASGITLILILLFDFLKRKKLPLRIGR